MLNRRKPSSRKSRARRLRLEALEERCLLSGSSPIPYGALPAVTLGLTAEQVDHADAVINWNAAMLRAIWNAGTPPTAASRVEAMVGVAVYDAVDGLHPIYEFYPVPGLGAGPHRGASPAAAAIAGADTVLNSLYPDQKAMFDAEYQASLARVPDGESKTDGIFWGQAVGNAVIAWRSQDGSNARSSYQAAPPGGPPGVYELTPNAGLEGKPPGFLPALAPQWGQVSPWAMTSAAQFLPPAPPALDSAEYAAAFNQTKSLGDTNSTTRTQDETLFSHFWADVPGHSVTPPGHWDEIAEHVSLQEHLNLEQNARLFALLNIGLADAAINCWNAKYVYNYWRPITAIRDQRANQINPATSSDPNWTPLWNTPNFPSYTSGHSTFSGAASVILASVFGRHAHFTIGSDDMPGYSRSFTSFAQAADEAGDSRVVGGIHFQFDNTAGLTAGRELGSYVVQNFLSPLDDDGSDRRDSRERRSPQDESLVLFHQPLVSSRGDGSFAADSSGRNRCAVVSDFHQNRDAGVELFAQTDSKPVTRPGTTLVPRAPKSHATQDLFAEFAAD
ncbi:MAG TPA: vanadium-dependent haloperoxidase [Gemmataceae bacterium]|nr:vanadium-dependent haloperoxidase [Gemmataceae bacterium]